MRDIVLTLLIFGLAAYALAQPRIGIYAWSFVSYMNPHRYTWGFAYSMPFAQIIVLATFIGLLLSKRPKSIPINGLMIIWFLFIAWMIFTTLFAIHSDAAVNQLVRVLKIQFASVLTIVLIRSRQDLRILLWVIALSLGVFGIKGGAFTILHLGAYHVFGPAGSFIEDNNELALALLMTIPYVYYLSEEAQTKLLKNALRVAIVLIAISILGSQSRGAFLAILVTGGFLWLKTPRKLLSGSLMLLFVLGAFMFMPQSWHDRMDTIQTYQEDASAMGRIRAWEMAINVASERAVGGGFQLWSPEAYQQYHDDPETWERNTVAHSIYFSVLGEHGWPGLLLFLALFYACWRTSKHIIRVSGESEDLRSLAALARMTQVSMVAYAVGGAFLSLSYFDLPYHIISIMVISRRIVDTELNQLRESEESRAGPIRRERNAILGS